MNLRANLGSIAGETQGLGLEETASETQGLGLEECTSMQTDIGWFTNTTTTQEKG